MKGRRGESEWFEREWRQWLADLWIGKYGPHYRDDLSCHGAVIIIRNLQIHLRICTVAVGILPFGMTGGTHSS